MHVQLPAHVKLVVSCSEGPLLTELRAHVMHPGCFLEATPPTRADLEEQLTDLEDVAQLPYGLAEHVREPAVGVAATCASFLVLPMLSHWAMQRTLPLLESKTLSKIRNIDAFAKLVFDRCADMCGARLLTCVLKLLTMDLPYGVQWHDITMIASLVDDVIAEQALLAGMLPTLLRVPSAHVLRIADVLQPWLTEGHARSPLRLLHPFLWTAADTYVNNADAALLSAICNATAAYYTGEYADAERPFSLMTKLKTLPALKGTTLNIHTPISLSYFSFSYLSFLSFVLPSNPGTCHF